jgi:uncharacterized Zn-binding protein involved in type VI secretion
MPVSNQNKTVVHAGSGHMALTVGDVCKLPALAPYPNLALSANLAAGKAAKTTVGGNAVAMEGTHWDPSSSPGMSGVGSGTTVKHAQVTSGSSDVFVEGKPVARAGDPTKQNGGNSSGSVTPGAVKPDADTVEKRAKLRCTVVKLTGKGHAAQLGFKGRDETGEQNYLEVWDTDTLTFLACREDISQKPAVVNPDCEAPTSGGKKHTIWRAAGKAFPLYVNLREKEEHGTDTFTVPANLVTEMWSSPSTQSAVANGDMSGFMSAYAKQAAQGAAGRPPSGFDRIERPEGWTDSSGDMFATQKQLGDPTGYANDRVGPAGAKGKYLKGLEHQERTVGKDGKVKLESQSTGGKDAPAKVFDGDIKQLLLFFWWGINPPSMTVTATGCAGGRSATVVVLPNYTITFSFSLSALKDAADRATSRSKSQQRQADQAQRNADQARKNRDAAKQRQNDLNAQRDGLKQKAYGDYKSSLSSHAKASAQNPGYSPSSLGGGRHGNDARRLANQSKKAGQKAQEVSEEAHKAWNQAVAAQAKFDNAEARLNQALDALKTAKRFVGLAEKISRVARAPLRFKFIEDVILEVEAKYERNVRGPSARGWRWYTSSTMNLAWILKLQGILIDMDWQPRVSLLIFINSFAPGVGTAAQRIGFKVDLVFVLKVELKAEASISKDQQDAFSGAVSLDPTLRTGFRLEIGFRRFDVVRVSGTLTLKGNVKFAGPKDTKDKTTMVELTPQVKFDNWVAITLFPDRWWGDYKVFAKCIRALRYNFNPYEHTRFPVFAKSE